MTDSASFGSEYQIILRDPFGNALRIIDNWVEFSYVRTVNAGGSFSMVMPDAYDDDLHGYVFDLFNRPDSRLEVWRSVNGGVQYLDMESIWFVNYLERALAADGAQTFTVKACDAIDLARRRMVLYADGNAKAEFASVPADNALKTLWKDNAGSTSTDTTRSLAVYVQVQANQSLAPNVTKAFAFRNVLDVMKEVAAFSASPETISPRYLAFDIVYVTTNLLEFRTYVDWRGTDHRFPAGQNPILLDPEQGNISEIKLIYDYTKEWTWVLATGQGSRTDQATETAQDNTRIGLSPFHRIEHIQSARNTTDATSLQAEANAILREGRPLRTFQAKLLQTAGATYGLHYKFGDVVSVNYMNTQFNCRIDSIKVSVKGGRETIDAVLRYDELLG